MECVSIDQVTCRLEGTAVQNPGNCGFVGLFVFFFFQAEDGIRDKLVTGVQTCALPICKQVQAVGDEKPPFQTVIGLVQDVKQAGLDKPTGTEMYVPMHLLGPLLDELVKEIGRASCRERV